MQKVINFLKDLHEFCKTRTGGFCLVFVIFFAIFNKEISSTFDGIVGKVSWRKISEYSESDIERRTAGSVAHVILTKKNSAGQTFRARCSGFLVNSAYELNGKVVALVMTNNHCIAGTFISSEFDFDYLDNPSSNKLKCNKVLVKDDSSDFALIACDRPMKDRKPLVLLEEFPKKSDDYAIISYNCDYFLDRGCRPFALIDDTHESKPYEYINEYYIRHSADSLGGSSGSPFFNTSIVKNDMYGVVAIHNSSVRDPKGEHPNSARYNYSKPMNRIVPMIKKYLPKEGGGSTTTTLPPNNGDPVISKNIIKTLIDLLKQIIKLLASALG